MSVHTQILAEAIASAQRDARDEYEPLTPGERSDLISVVHGVRMLVDGEYRVSRAVALRLAADLLTRAGVDAMRRQTDALAAELDAGTQPEARGSDAP